MIPSCTYSKFSVKQCPQSLLKATSPKFLPYVLVLYVNIRFWCQMLIFCKFTVIAINHRQQHWPSLNFTITPRVYCAEMQVKCKLIC